MDDLDVIRLAVAVIITKIRVARTGGEMNKNFGEGYKVCPKHAT